MKNTVLSVMLVGIVAIGILGSGLFTYKTASDVISDDTIDAMSTQEIMAFNSNFETYQGRQTGSQVRALLTFCNANVRTYEDDPDKVPTIVWSQLKEDEEVDTININSYHSSASLDTYTGDISTISSELELKHTYRVILTEDEDTGLVHQISIKYDVDDDEPFDLDM